MDKFLFMEYAEGEARVNALDANSDAIEEITYTRRFTPDELADMRSRLADNSIEESDIEAKKKEEMDRFKDQLKPIQKAKTTLLSKLKTKTEQVTESCYKMINRDERLVGYYNSDGELVSARPLNAQEMQKTIFEVTKTGTNY